MICSDLRLASFSFWYSSISASVSSALGTFLLYLTLVGTLFVEIRLGTAITSMTIPNTAKIILEKSRAYEADKKIISINEIINLIKK